MAALELSRIRLDGGTQIRVGINVDVTQEYAEAMLAGDKFPPVVVFFDGTDYWLADGFHRVMAAQALDFPEIAADVREGTKRDAVLFSAGANATHGLRRTNQDKRAAVRRLLEDEEWAQWSDREIARRCAVTHPFVSEVRKTLSGNAYQMKRTVTRAGRTYEQDTSKIGKGKPVDKSSIDTTKPPDVSYVVDENNRWQATRELTEAEAYQGKEFRRRDHASLDAIDLLEQCLKLDEARLQADALPEWREEIGGLLNKAAAHLGAISKRWSTKDGK